MGARKLLPIDQHLPPEVGGTGLGDSSAFMTFLGNSSQVHCESIQVYQTIRPAMPESSDFNVCMLKGLRHWLQKYLSMKRRNMTCKFNKN